MRNWLHAGMVQMESEKMSKSLGNIVLARDVVEQYGGETARYWMLASSLRSQAVFSDDTLDDAARALRTVANVPRVCPSRSRRRQRRLFPPPTGDHRGDPAPEGAGAEFIARFLDAMDDDFNSAEAFAAIHDLVQRGQQAASRGPSAAMRPSARRWPASSRSFLELTSVLELPARVQGGRFRGSSVAWSSTCSSCESPPAPRRRSTRADAIRDRLTELGVAIEDTPAGPRWRVSGTG